MNVQQSLPENQDEAVIHVGVQCFVTQNDKILLGKRNNIFGHGSWGLPGGHLEKGETILDAARRELLEETNLIAHKLKIIAISEGGAETNYHLQIGVLAEEWSGTPQIMEPDYCSAIAFFDMTDFPEPIFVASSSLIHKFCLGVLY